MEWKGEEGGVQGMKEMHNGLFCLDEWKNRMVLHTAYKSEEIQTTSSKLSIEGGLIVAKSRGLVAQLPSNFPMVLS